MTDEVKIVNEFDRNGHHFKIGVSADGQVPKGLEIDGQMLLQLPIDCDAAID